jgi:uncharacterized membrane protein YedE/YeeE
MTDQPTEGTVAGATPGATQPAAQPAAASPSLSIISMILGILGFVIGFVGGGLLFSIGAVVLGHLGQRKEPAARGFWITGLVTGYVGVLINVAVVAVWIAVVIGFAAAPDMYEQFERWGTR